MAWPKQYMHYYLIKTSLKSFVKILGQQIIWKLSQKTLSSTSTTFVYKYGKDAL